MFTIVEPKTCEPTACIELTRRPRILPLLVERQLAVHDLVAAVGVAQQALPSASTSISPAGRPRRDAHSTSPSSG